MTATLQSALADIFRHVTEAAGGKHVENTVFNVEEFTVAAKFSDLAEDYSRDTKAVAAFIGRGCPAGRVAIVSAGADACDLWLLLDRKPILCMRFTGGPPVPNISATLAFAIAEAFAATHAADQVIRAADTLN